MNITFSHQLVSSTLAVVWYIASLNIFFRLVKHLLWKLNQTQPTTIYLDVTVSIRGLRQKKMKLILLPVLATVVMWRGKKSVVRVAQCVIFIIKVCSIFWLLTFSVIFLPNIIKMWQCFRELYLKTSAMFFETQCSAQSPVPWPHE